MLVAGRALELVCLDREPPCAGAERLRVDPPAGQLGFAGLRTHPAESRVERIRSRPLDGTEERRQPAPRVLAKKRLLPLAAELDLVEVTGTFGCEPARSQAVAERTRMLRSKGGKCSAVPHVSGVKSDSRSCISSCVRL